ncbi:hypothetical protein D3C81_1945220 [compost metagenome]
MPAMLLLRAGCGFDGPLKHHSRIFCTTGISPSVSGASARTQLPRMTLKRTTQNGA